ncbi:cobalt transporter (plasmid) [Fulvitalea axinellae]|uniref:Cobalt transporter n=1 Tax=Fulvitalea axinellae TaxID=1182444 RepID=A0AAU9CZT6_9BACT|nr:cobalt transporter [Fulvitalea axinellae]
MAHSHSHGHNHGHGHHHHHHGDLKGTKLAVTIFLNILITVGQAVGGLLSGSLSLLSDALHNFSDVVALLISYFANKLTKRPSCQRRTFGYKRAEIVAAMINSATLLVIAVFLIKEAVERLYSPIEIKSVTVMVLAGLSVLLNGASVLLIKDEADNNMNMRSAYLHLFTDMISSVAVLIGGAVMFYFKIYWVDSLLSIAVALYLIYSSYGLLTQTLKVLMQFAPSDIQLESVSQKVTEHPDVKGMHHAHLWQLNDNDTHLEAHIEFEKNIPISDTATVFDNLKKTLLDEFDINHVTFQAEFESPCAHTLIEDER